MKFIYCPICSDKLIEKEIGDEGLVRYCASCQRPYFDEPSSCVEVLVINERNQILLLKQNYITETHWGVVSGHVTNGETLEETVVREVLEETGQEVERMQYVESYYFMPNELIMAGFIAFVHAKPFNNSNEVDDLMWCEIGEVNKYIARVNNMSGIHFDNSMRVLKMNN
ncbi:NUDIX domain-containing protein [Clostridium oryzae]|uniref:NADH pyrophosphatase n=1 Tax=Clostridium oryzae TaxID=1450648 RepID=A0A1V4IV60_9CLOT|nr:NUDIX domain-containing protein [Clostridium oryzae]OPJ63826.1 NADH pyrophosphatase [Clostridium oryzae]